MQLTALAIQVAAMTVPKSIPQRESTAGCTKTMYDIVRKIVAPAMASVRTFVRFSFILNIFSRIIVFANVFKEAQTSFLKVYRRGHKIDSNEKPSYQTKDRDEPNFCLIYRLLFPKTHIHNPRLFGVIL